MLNHSISGSIACDTFRHRIKAHPVVHVQANTELLEAREEPAGVSVKARIVSTGKTDVDVYDSVILCTGLDDETILEFVCYRTGVETTAAKECKIATDTP